MDKVGKKIALVHDFLTVFAGGERVLLALHKMYPEAPIYTMFYNPEIVHKHFPNATIYTSPLQRSFLKNKPWLLLSWMPGAVESYDLTKYDVVISSSGAFSHGVITGPDTHHISYCHSPMRYAWDYHAEYLREKGITSPWKLFFANQFMNKLRLWDAVSAKRVDIWVANSKTVADRIAKYYRAKAEVIYPPVDTEFFDATKSKPAKTDQPYFFTISRLSKNKRVNQMIEAAAQTGSTLHVGGSGIERENLENLARSHKARVAFLGNLTEEEKRAQILGSQAFLFAAEDDFGIAPVEALALGIPVIALGKGGATESVHSGKNGLLYPEATSASLAVALQEFKDSGVSMSPAEIRNSSLRFNTDAFATAIHNLVTHA